MRKNLFWLSEEQWARIEPHLPTDVRGVERVDDRRVISGIVHVPRAVVAGAIAHPSTVRTRRSITASCAGRGVDYGRTYSGNWPAAGDRWTRRYRLHARQSASLGLRWKRGRKIRLWAVRAEGATRRFMHSQMLRGA